MGLDGFSMGTLGLNANLTSAQMAIQSEQIAQKESEIKIKDVTKAASDQGIKRKEEDEENPNEQAFEDGFKDSKDDSQDEDSFNNQNPTSNLTEKSFENRDPKEFSVRINKETEMVELINNKEERVLETMSAKDLMGLVSKLNGASGILVNRKI